MYDIISIFIKWDFIYQEYKTCSSNVITKLIMVVTFAKNDLLKGIDCLHSTSSSFIVLKVLKVYCLKAFFGRKPIRPRNFKSFIATNYFG